MLSCNILLLSLSLILIISALPAQDDIVSKFQSFEIVPDAIPCAPENPLEIKYPSGVEVSYGNELTPTDVKDLPLVTWKASPEDYHTLIFIDLDAPSRKEPIVRAVKHWLVVNIPGSKLEDGETIVEFIGSGAPKGTDLHRYVFFVFKQLFGKMDFSGEERASKRDVKSRVNFSTIKFADKYSLQLLGGNFYQAQYDDYVPTLHAQFLQE